MIRSAATLITLAIAATAIAADRPNVLLICVDDLKPIAGCYGGSAITPNIDRLAARGMRFDSAYCNQAVCSPSRNALLTSLRPQTLGIYDLGTNFRKSRPDAVTLPQAFQQAGYSTEALGKIFHVGHGNDDDKASWTVPSWKASVVAYHLPESKAPTGLTREEALFSNQPASNLPRGAAYESADVADNQYPDGAMTDEVVRRLTDKAQHPDQAFFMAVGFVKPHLPFVAPKKYWDLYDATQLPQPELKSAPANAPDFAATSWGELRQYKGMPDKGPLSDEQQRTLIHGYHAATSYMDAQLGRVLDCLDQTSLAKNTLIVFWGDHGWHLGDHGQWCKHTNYEQAARIPVIVAGPQVAAGEATRAMIESVDIYPTLCELAGLDAPDGLDGRSFTAVLHDAGQPARDSVQHVYPRGDRMGRAIRTATHRLVEWKPIGAPAEDAVIELYDLATDALETKNIAAAHPDLVSSLRAILAQQPEAKPQIRNQPAKSADAKKSQDRNQMFDRRDTDNNDRLTRDEFLANQPDPDKAPARFIEFDVNSDGQLSREEFVTSGKVRTP